MKFVDLDRSFVPVAKDKEPILNAGIWGRKYGGWNSWADLLERRRVVLLAEASSGKSEEFTNQQAALEAAGKIAFFMRIEELADQGFEDALEAHSADRFKSWVDSTDEAYFFLDSVDEARLNQKSFEMALKRFARDLGKALGGLAGAKTADHVVRLLMVIERCDRSYSTDDGPSLRTLVNQNALLKRALFWADLAEIRANGRDAVQKPTRIWQVFLSGGGFWELGVTDLEWLYRDLHSRTAEDDKRIILSAIVKIHMRENALEAELPKLRTAIAGILILEADLAEYGVGCDRE